MAVTLAPGAADEVLVSCHCCHPSLANDNLSGIVIAAYLARRGFQVTGLDASARMVALAREAVPGEQFVHADMRTASLDEIFDAIETLSKPARVTGDRLLKMIAVPPQRGKTDRAWLGITLQALTPDLSEMLKLPVENGIIVNDVVEQSPASKIGVKSTRRSSHFNGLVDGRRMRMREKSGNGSPLVKLFNWVCDRPPPSGSEPSSRYS